MTTNAELIDLAMGRLTQRKSVRLRAAVVNEINSVINQLERGKFFPWFLQQTATLSALANSTFVALPLDFALEKEESKPYYVLEGKVFYLTKRLYAVLQGETPNTTRLYAIFGGSLHYRAMPSEDLTINLLYYAKAGGNLVDNTTALSNPWLIEAQEWVVNKALTTVAADVVGDVEKGLTFAAKARAAHNDLYAYHESRTHQNQDYFVGGSTDGS